MRDEEGTAACEPDGILNAAIREAADAADGRLVVMADLCLDEFTSHGHCGVLDADGLVDNDATLAVYRAHGDGAGRAGADVLGLSGMMDGQVAAVRDALEQAGSPDVAVLAYSAKYASAFYGPVQRRGGIDARRAIAAPTKWTPATRARAYARRGSTSPRAPTSS